MGGIRINTKVTGPFFDYGAAPIKDATEATIRDLVKEGEAKVEQQLYPGHGVLTGAYKRSVHGKVLSSAHGVIDEDNSVKGKFLEMGRYWPSTGHRFKGYAAFRKAKTHLNRIARELAGKQYKRAVKRLT